MIIKNYGGRLMETNSTIFYTTAQVTEMVELSDQNVRKYVRLLEDRNYEVAKDEHNRRLFSGDDVAILQELIILAKQPGYTLETAADQLANSEANNVVNAQPRTPAVTSSNEFAELLTSVVRRMDDMRHEQKELKEKMDLLISKLEQTSSTFEKSMITHEEKKEDNETVVKATETVSEETKEDSADVPAKEEAADAVREVKTEETVEEPAKESKEETVEVNATESNTEDVKKPEEQTDENSDESQMFEADKRQNEKRIDMTTYETKSPEQNSQEEAPKEEKGAFGRFLDFLKGK